MLCAERRRMAGICVFWFLFWVFLPPVSQRQSECRLQGVLLLKQQNPRPHIILSSRGSGRPALPLLPPSLAVGTGRTSLPGVE